jgi:hypothetical protein
MLIFLLSSHPNIRYQSQKAEQKGILIEEYVICKEGGN